MKLSIYKLLIHIFPLLFIFIVPLNVLGQSTGWEYSQNGYWEKIHKALGLNSTAARNKNIVASSPNSIVAMRILATLDTPAHQVEGESFFTIIKSTDRGNSWQIFYKDTNDRTRGFDVDHPSENVTGWLMWKDYGGNSAPAFKYTTDGGKTFETVEHQIGGGIIKGDEEGINVSMYDEQHWAFATFDRFSLKDHTYVYITHDGGKTWQEQEFALDLGKGGKFQVVFRGPDKLSVFPIVRRPDAKVRVSEDGGDTWKKHGKLPNQVFSNSNFDFPTPDVGYVGGYIGNEDNKLTDDTAVIYKTTDGGRSWKKILEKQYPQIGLLMGVFDVECISKNKCITGGAPPNLIRTTNGGKTWTIDSFANPDGVNVSRPFFAYTANNEEQLGLFLGRSGRLYRFNKSTNPTTGKEQVSDQKQGLSIYPNPSDGAFRIRWQGQEAVAGTLYNMQGQAVRSFQLAPQQEVTYSLSGIQAGTYILEVNGRDIAKKVLIKQE